MNQETKSARTFPLTGVLIDERFQITSRIADQHLCPVVAARDLRDQKEKALLIIPAEIVNDAEAFDHLCLASKSLLWLNHPNIARFYGLHESARFNYLELDLLHGENLRIIKFNSLNKRLPENKVNILAQKIVEGLAHAHDQNILHRSLTPARIVLTRDYKVKITDFGMADALRNSLSMVRDVTYKNPIQYMSPEQVNGKALTVRSDIYSFGALLYDLLAGHPPFSSGDIYSRILHEKPERITGISAKMNHLLQICLAKDAGDRFRSCAELQVVLEELAGTFRQEYRRPAIPEKPVVASSAPVAPIPQKKRSQFPKIIIGKNVILTGASILLIMLAGMIVGRIFFGGFNSPQIIKKQTISNQNNDHLQIVGALKKAADSLFALNRLLSPPGNNAIELYREVLNAVPDDRHALTQIVQIRLKTINEIKQCMLSNNADETRQLMELAQKHFPGDAELAVINTVFAVDVHRLDILNGIGERGAAKFMSEQLVAMGYQSQNTDNHRLSGQLIWNVDRSRLIYRRNHEQAARQLASKLGISDIRLLTNENMSQQSNIALVIGRDYRNLPFFQAE